MDAGFTETKRTRSDEKIKTQKETTVIQSKTALGRVRLKNPFF